MSQVGSKAAVDPENMRVHTADWKAGILLCLDFDPSNGFTTRWTRQQKMFSFLSLFGDAAHRQIVGTDYDSSYGDQVVWRDAATGDEVRAQFLARIRISTARRSAPATTAGSTTSRKPGKQSSSSCQSPHQKDDGLRKRRLP